MNILLSMYKIQDFNDIESLNFKKNLDLLINYEENNFLIPIIDKDLIELDNNYRFYKKEFQRKEIKNISNIINNSFDYFFNKLSVENINKMKEESTKKLKNYDDINYFLLTIKEDMFNTIIFLEKSNNGLLRLSKFYKFYWKNNIIHIPFENSYTTNVNKIEIIKKNLSNNEIFEIHIDIRKSIELTSSVLSNNSLILMSPIQSPEQSPIQSPEQSAIQLPMQSAIQSPMQSEIQSSNKEISKDNDLNFIGEINSNSFISDNNNIDYDMNINNKTEISNHILSDDEMRDIGNQEEEIIIYDKNEKEQKEEIKNKDTYYLNENVLECFNLQETDNNICSNSNDDVRIIIDEQPNKLITHNDIKQRKSINNTYDNHLNNNSFHYNQNQQNKNTKEETFQIKCSNNLKKYFNVFMNKVTYFYDYIRGNLYNFYMRMKKNNENSRYSRNYDMGRKYDNSIIYNESYNKQ